MRAHPLKRVEAATEAAEIAVGEAIVAWLRRRGWACRLNIHDWWMCRVSFVFDPDTYYPMERCRECMRLRPSSDGLACICPVHLPCKCGVDSEAR